MAAACYGIDRKSVVFERFDDELIAINLATGTYYSLNPTGAEIFELLSHGCSAEDASSILEKRYTSGSGPLVLEIQRFFEILRREGLIEPTTLSEAMNFPDSAASGRIFEPPVLSAHRDMQELFLLDPIHDTGKAGWPQTQADAEDR